MTGQDRSVSTDEQDLQSLPVCFLMLFPELRVAAWPRDSSFHSQCWKSQRKVEEEEEEEEEEELGQIPSA